MTDNHSQRDPNTVKEAETHIAEDAAVAAANGATAGSVIGPVGLAAGAVVGAVTSVTSAFTHPHPEEKEASLGREDDEEPVVIEERSS